MPQKHTPLRMCTGCSEMKPKNELIRVVKSNTGEISLDKRGKLPGRGAYVCNSMECLKKARKTRRIERAFSMKIPDEIYAALEEAMEQNE